MDALNAVHGQNFECINSAELCKYFLDMGGVFFSHSLCLMYPIYLWLLDPAAGASDDYYASLGSRFVYTPELRDNGFGFVLPPQYIIPSGEEVWAAWEVMLDKIMPNKEQWLGKDPVSRAYE